MKVLAALGSEVGRKGRRRNGMSNAGGNLSSACQAIVAPMLELTDVKRYVPLDFNS